MPSKPKPLLAPQRTVAEQITEATRLIEAGRNALMELAEQGDEQAMDTLVSQANKFCHRIEANTEKGPMKEKWRKLQGESLFWPTSASPWTAWRSAPHKKEREDYLKRIGSSLPIKFYRRKPCSLKTSSVNVCMGLFILLRSPDMNGDTFKKVLPSLADHCLPARPFKFASLKLRRSKLEDLTKKERVEECFSMAVMLLEYHLGEDWWRHFIKTEKQTKRSAHHLYEEVSLAKDKSKGNTDGEWKSKVRDIIKPGFSKLLK